MEPVTLPPRPVRRYRARLFQLYLVLAVLGFVVLFYFARTTPYFGFDLTITREIQEITWKPFDALMLAISVPGFSPQSYVLTAVIVLALFLLRLRWEAFCALFAAGVALAGYLIKALVARPRPPSDLVIVAGPLDSSSFPSGHVLFYTALFGFLIFLLYTRVHSAWWRTVGIVLFGALVALIGISRIYLGQHWFSDVVAAYLLGSLWLVLTTVLYRWGKR